MTIDQDKLSIDILELGALLWRGKYLLVASILISILLSATFLFLQPSIYRAEAVVALADNQEPQSAASSLLTQVGALRGIGGAGGFGQMASETGQSLAILRSRAFVVSFLREHDLVPLVLAGQQGESERSATIDPAMYDDTSGNWLVDFSDGQQSPSDWEIYSRFSEILEIVQDIETGLVRIRIDWFDPEQARQWISWLISDINDHIRESDLKEAEESISFLQSQVSKTQLIDMKNVFYNLIESQTQVTMLADVREGYAFKVIDPPIIFDRRVSPDSVVTLLAGLVGGIVLGVMLLLILNVRVDEYSTNNHA